MSSLIELFNAAELGDKDADDDDDGDGFVVVVVAAVVVVVVEDLRVEDEDIRGNGVEAVARMRGLLTTVVVPEMMVMGSSFFTGIMITGSSFFTEIATMSSSRSRGAGGVAAEVAEDDESLDEE